MTFNPGRNIGRLSIRVVPDTTKFRKDLVRRLETIARTTKMTVNVNKAKLDNAAIREDIRRQLATFKGLDADVSVRATVDRVRLRKKTLQKSIQQQFDRFDDIRVNIAAEVQNVERFEKQVRDMVDRASKNRVKIHASAITLDASAQLKWVSRDRFVNLVVRVSKASVVSAATTLAALSGARLSWKWIDSLAQSMKELDRSLPTILGWTTGITSMVGAVFAATSGLVGLGQGLVSITPAFLVIPGLLLNALGSATALIVALRNAGTELAPLKSDMQELGDIINETFWGRARQPILDLVTGLMPQLRNSFRDISEGIGDFTGALSNAFAVELSGGRMESIFRGIADGWRTLATGAPAFAGAMTSLSQIAATYTPRLASWFVRQADTFDNWLTAIATDGRLGDWMETAISSMYDLWDVTRGVAGVFEGLWSAAKAAGSKGLAGFADSMLTWERVVKGADFQRGMTAVFRGSNTAMSAFGDAFTSIGRLVADLDKTTERFIGSAGKFFGGLIDASALALNTPQFGRGVDDFSAGLLRALEGIKPSLQPIADTFGSFLGLLGDLAGTLLPTATNVLAELMPTIESVIGSIRDSGVLDTLGKAVTDIAESLGPALARFADAAGPLLVDAIVGLSDAIVDLTPAVTGLIDAIAAFLQGVDEWSSGNQSFFDGIREALGIDKNVGSALKQMGELSSFMPKDDGNPFTIQPKFDFDRMWNGANGTAAEKAREIASVFSNEYQLVMDEKGPEAAKALLDGLREIDGIPPEVIAKINDQLKVNFALQPLKGPEQSELDRVVSEVRKAYESGGQEGAQAMWEKVTAFNPLAIGSTANMRHWAVSELKDIGISITTGLEEGVRQGTPGVSATIDGLNQHVRDLMAGSGTLLVTPGADMVTGLNTGITSQLPAVYGQFTGFQTTVSGQFAGAGSWLYGAGQDVMNGFAEGIRSAAWRAASEAVAAGQMTIDEMRRNLDIRSPSRKAARMVGEPFADGIAMGIDNRAKAIRKSMVGAMDMTGLTGGNVPVVSGGQPGSRSVTLNINNPVVADMQADAWQAAQIAEAVLG